MEPETEVENEIGDDKYMGYRLDDLSESLGDALGKNTKIKQSLGSSYFEISSIDWNILMSVVI